MKIKQFEVLGLAQYSYMVSSQGQAIVIDPIRDFDRYLAYAEENNLTITHITETHIHADFAAGTAGLAEATGAQLALSGYDEGELYQYTMPHRAMRNGDAIEVGTLRLQALHTPGHTPEHLSFLLFDTKRSMIDPAAFFTGDFLFAGSLGRPDLLGEEAKHGLAHDLYRSLHHRIAAVPDSVIVYPGHGAGSLCGAGMSEAADSTLGYERSTQHLFQLMEEEFVEQVLASVPPMPAYYPRMKGLNATGAPSMTTLPAAPEFTAAELQRSMDISDLTLLDVRDVETFAAAHIRGALNLGAGPSLSLWAGWLLDAETPIVVLTEPSDRDEATTNFDEVRRSLLRVGLDRIAGHMPMQRWLDAAYSSQAMPLLSAAEVSARTNALPIDVRNDDEWDNGHIAHAIHVPLGDLPRALTTLPRTRPIVTICGSGYRAAAAASLLTAAGFDDVSIMDGGMAAWSGDSLPTSGLVDA